MGGILRVIGARKTLIALIFANDFDQICETINYIDVNDTSEKERKQTFEEETDVRKKERKTAEQKKFMP